LGITAASATGRRSSLKRNPPLDFAEGGKILAPIVELGNARVGMIRHVLRCLQRAAILQEHSDASTPKGVIADALREFGCHAKFLDDAQHIAPGNPSDAERMILIQRLKHRRGILVDLRRVEVRVQELLGFVMQPDKLFLVAFFQQPQPRALALQAVIAALESQHRTDPCEGIFETPTEYHTLTKVWITPGKSKVVERGSVAIIEQSNLRVLTEVDYVATTEASAPRGADPNAALPANSLALEAFKKIALPVIEREANFGGNFALLRQVYASLILAMWYRQVLRRSATNEISVAPQFEIGDEDPAVTHEGIFRQYLRSHKRGVFNYIRQEARNGKARFGLEGIARADSQRRALATR
jgi:hypothetical protein